MDHRQREKNKQTNMYLENGLGELQFHANFKYICNFIITCIVFLKLAFGYDVYLFTSHQIDRKYWLKSTVCKQGPC